MSLRMKQKSRRKPGYTKQRRIKLFGDGTNRRPNKYAYLAIDSVAELRKIAAKRGSMFVLYREDLEISEIPIFDVKRVFDTVYLVKLDPMSPYPRKMRKCLKIDYSIRMQYADLPVQYIYDAAGCNVTTPPRTRKYMGYRTKLVFRSRKDAEKYRDYQRVSDRLVPSRTSFPLGPASAWRDVNRGMSPCPQLFEGD